MGKRRILTNIHHLITVKSTICAGLALLVVVTAFAGHFELKSTETLAAETIATLKRQCISYNKLTASDRAKSLFRLSDLMRDFRTHLVYNPELATDENLERYVDSLRLTGIALLDENMNLEASGYTRQYQGSSWTTGTKSSQFADILNNPQIICTERVLVDGEYYDTCALARLDAPGILIGFYQQPSGLISNTETDLESLLSGLQLEQDGHYIIAENGTLRVTSESIDPKADSSDETLLNALSQIPKDGKLHFFYGAGRHLWGYHSGCEQYSLYLYYPLFSLFSAYVSTIAIFTAAYCILCLLYFATRNQTLYENQEQLRKSNEGLNQIVKMLKALETIYFSLFYVDIETGAYRSVYVAPWLKAVIPDIGSYATLKKTFVENMIAPEYRDTIDTQMEISNVRERLHQKNLTDVRNSFYVDYKALRNDLTPWCRVTATPVDYDETGNPLHFLALIQDIDKDKAREADYQARILKEAHEAKVANNAKTEFLRRISHDIRTPINGVQGYLQLIAEHPGDQALQIHCREKASLALKNLMELVNNALDMSKLESGTVIQEEKAFDLTELLDSVNAVLSPQAKAKNITYEAPHPEAMPLSHLIGSPRLLSQVILNITSNAVKYTPPGGWVRMDTHLDSQTEDTVTYSFVCTDNGVGMSQEFQAHMFEPFTQETADARTSYAGTGLGLSIVKKLVDVLGGTISCQSQKGVGTTFTIRLTFRVDARHAEAATVPEAVTGGLLRGRRVLLVEDNELNMEIADYLFSEQGAAVIRAWNGLEAVDAFAASEEYGIDLIVMDVMMPKMGGREATRTIRGLNRRDAKTVPIVAMSANSFQDDVEKNLAAGMNTHISKPIDGPKLISVINALLGSSLPENSCA